MPLTAIIVEDEANSREILRNYLSKYCPDVNLVGEATSIQEAKGLIGKNTIDLVFLDVEMPFGTGFDFLDQLPERTFETVFVTAYDQYAIDALNNHAAYYLMKPINIDELIKAVDYVKEIIHKSYLVNVNEVVKYKKGKGGSVVVSNGKQLLVSAAKKKELLAYF